MCHLGCSTLPYQLGIRAVRPLTELSPARATASPWSPNSSRAEADRPIANTLGVHSSQKRARQKRSKTRAIKNYLKRSPESDPTGVPSKTIRNEHTCAFPYCMAHSQRAVASHHTAPLRPTTHVTAGQCSSSVAASSMAGKTRAAHALTIFLKKKRLVWRQEHFLDTGGGFMGVEPSKTGLLQKDHVFQLGAFEPQDAL